MEVGKKNKIAIVGAGPGGLVAGLILNRAGFDVEIFEKEKIPGGRNSYFLIDGHKFDIGPTFLMMKYVLDDIFERIGLRAEDHLKFTRLSPMYRLHFAEKHIDIYEEKDKMAAELERVFSGEKNGLGRFYKREESRFKKMMPCLTKDYSSFAKFFHKDFISALPHFSLGRSLFGVLGDYFQSSDARLCFTFQSKYIGMSPWECPGAFGLIPYVEHAFGIYHVEGGLSRISEAMAEIFIKRGGRISYGTIVKKIAFEGERAVGLELADGRLAKADKIIVNADFAYAMSELMPKGTLPKYSPEKLAKKDYSCSTIMFYWGLKRRYSLPHHSVVFAKEYRRNIENIFSGRLSGADSSFYIRNASATDSAISPESKSQFYILIPCPNQKLGREIDWKKAAAELRPAVIMALKERLGLSDIEEQIECEKVITPDDWVGKHNVHYGATFNLSHKLTQMLWFRPRNRLEGVRNVYLVGGGTHPGSGLPTIYESGRISAELLIKDLKNEKR